MLAELGQLALAAGCVLALLQGFVPLCGLALHRPAWVVCAAPLARLQFVFLAVAFLILSLLFVRNDFSVAYVANNSNTALPLGYRLSAVWGGHEGSLLLWVLLLSLWTLAVIWCSRQIPEMMRARVVGILGLVSGGFLLFVTLTSSPFARLTPAPAQGRDLNPLLQDLGLIIHPPMLYMGYVGFSVTFACAIAALLSGKMDSAWARWMRPWALIAWVFLTIGIMLGSWWAYYELGWGGWWFWDPVENASFMPWLTGTALLHSLAATDARNVFKPWTALLAIITFSLCLLGTFLVRSGVLISVHAFASDPARGLFILMLLVVTVGGSLVLYAVRASKLAGIDRFAPLSRETGILCNNLFLTVAAASVLLGTLYPLMIDAVGAGKISVGPPYFNSVFVPLAAVPAALAVVGAISHWKSESLRNVLGKLSWPMLAAVTVGALLPLFASGPYKFSAAGGYVLAFWIFFGTARAALDRMLAGKQAKQTGTGSFWGMIIAHIGIAIFVIGVTSVSIYEKEKNVRLIVGEQHELDGKIWTLEKMFEEKGANYIAAVGIVRVTKDGNPVAMLRPEKRFYLSQPGNLMTEAGISVGWNKDYYVSLGERLDDRSWSGRLQTKPFIRFVWGGALLMALGGLTAVADRRFRRRKSATGWPVAQKGKGGK